VGNGELGADQAAAAARTVIIQYHVAEVSEGGALDLRADGFAGLRFGDAAPKQSHGVGAVGRAAGFAMALAADAVLEPPDRAALVEDA
jgi:hypothetical protein